MRPSFASCTVAWPFSIETVCGPSGDAGAVSSVSFLGLEGPEGEVEGRVAGALVAAIEEHGAGLQLHLQARALRDAILFLAHQVHQQVDVVDPVLHQHRLLLCAGKPAEQDNRQPELSHDTNLQREQGSGCRDPPTKAAFPATLFPDACSLAYPCTMATEEQTRLAALYQDSSDDELLALYADRGNLTDAAEQALSAEIASRHLSLPVAEPETRAPEYTPDLVSDLHGDGLTALITFYNGLDLGLACDHLGDAGMELAVRPIPGTEVSAEAFQIRVSPADQPRAEEILRAKMGLFPRQEVSEEETMSDSGEMVILGEFPTEEEATKATTALETEGIIYRLTAPEEDGENDEPGYSVEVRADDLDHGLAVVADALGLK